MISDQDTIYFAIVFLVWILSLSATYKATKRKGRSSLWIFLTFVFFPLFFIVELLPNKSNKEIKMIDCEACKQEISSVSKICPHCGHPNSFYKKSKISLYEWVIGALIIIVLPVGFILKSPMQGIPDCNSSYAIDSVERTFQTIPLIKSMGVTIIKISDITVISNSEIRNVCKATVILSNTQEYQLQYKLTRKDDIIYTEVKILD